MNLHQFIWELGIVFLWLMFLNPEDDVIAPDDLEVLIVSLWVFLSL